MLAFEGIMIIKWFNLELKLIMEFYWKLKE